MKSRVLTVLLIVIAWALAGVQGAGAQTPIRIASMSIGLWPEYDKPGVLFIYTGRLAPDVKLPVRLTFAIPKSSGGPSSTAGIDAQGNYRYLQYQTVEQGDLLLVSYTCPYPAFQFEYYDNQLVIQGNERKLDYVYTADFAIDALTLEIQQPIGASGLQTQPPATSTQNRDQFVYQYVNVGPLAAGQTTRLTATYVKSDARLSGEILGLPTPSSVQFEDIPKAATPAGLPTSTVILIAVTVVAVAAVVGVYLWSQGRQKRRPAVAATPAPARRKGKRARATQPAANSPPGRPAAPASSANAYCHQCGRGLKADEIFCPACGARRKGA